MTRDSGGREGWSVLAVVVGILLALVGIYVAAVLVAGEKVPRNTTVAGVAIGGLDPATAEQKLRRDLGAQAEEPLAVRVGVRRFSLDPADVGVSLDAAATVERAGGVRSFAPARLYALVFGGGSVTPVLSFDSDALQSAVERIAERVDQPADEGGITFTADGSTAIDFPTPGSALEVTTATGAIQETYLAGDRSVRLPVQRVPPQINAERLRSALTEVAEPAVSGPVTLRFGARTVRLSPDDFAPALSMVPGAGQLELQVDEATLRAQIGPRLERVEVQPRDATVVLRNGEPVVVRDRTGQLAGAGALADALLSAVSEQADRRTAEVELVRQPAERTTPGARRLGIREVVSSFVTYYPHARYRNVNQGRAAELINGTLLEPGDTFSFNETVGERTRANGFTKGIVIADGVFTEALGGGVSQVVTTTFNAAYFAGLADVEHTPHSFYIDRYPAGREATVSWPDLDLKFRNNTPDGILIDAWVVPSTPTSDGEMHVRMWGTKHWSVKTTTSEPYDPTEPGVQRDDTKACIGQDGVRGFQIDVTRKLFLDGNRVSNEVLHTEYLSADEVICTKPSGS